MLYKLLLLFCLYLPFQIALNPAEGIDLASGRVFIILLFLIWPIGGLKNKKLFVPFKIQTLLILSFLFISAFSLFWAENLDWGTRKVLFLFSIFPVYFMVSGLLYPSSPYQGEDTGEVGKKRFFHTSPQSPPYQGGEARVIKFLTWGAGIVAIVGIIQFLLQIIIGLDASAALWRNFVTPVFLGKEFTQAVLEYPSWLVNIGGHNYLRAFATFPDPHMFSFYLGLTLPMAMGLYYASVSRGSASLNQNGPKRPSLYLFLFFIILLADLLTFSRGGYVGLTAGLIFVILYFTANKKIPAKKLFASSMLILIIFASLALTPVGKRFYASFSVGEGSNKIRFENWRQAVEVIKNNPLGTGIGNYSYEIEPSADYRKPIYAHNLYLDIAAETGIVNAVIFLLLIITSVKSLIKKSPLNPPLEKGEVKGDLKNVYLGAAVSLVIFSVHSIFDTALYSAQVLPLLLIIIALDASE